MVSVLGRIFSWSVPGKLGRLNSGRNPRRTAITAAALMVGIALVTGVTVVMDSAKTSLAAQAEDTVKAQVVIGGDQNGPRPPTFDPAVLAKARDIPGVRDAAGLWNDQARIDGKRTYVNATDDLARLADAYGGPVFDRPCDPTRSRSAPSRPPSAAGRSAARWTCSWPAATPTSTRSAATYDEDLMPGSYLLPAAATKDFGITQPLFGFVRLDRRHHGGAGPAAAQGAGRGQPRGVGDRPQRVHPAAGRPRSTR